MRILWLSFVDAAHNAPYFERLSRYLNDIAAPGTSVDVAGTSPPDRDFGRLTEFRCAALAIDRCIEAEAQGYDAFVMGHFQDPGLYEARSAVRIPVVGAGEATLHFAAQLGRRLGLVSIDPVFEVWHYEQAERYGLRDRISGVAGLGFVPEDFNPAFAGDESALARMRGCAGRQLRLRRTQDRGDGGRTASPRRPRAQPRPELCAGAGARHRRLQATDRRRAER